MAGIEGTLTTIAACGGVGYFIDFWIGKQGQKRVRDWLETWWLRFSYVDIRNLGQKEAEFALRLMARHLGPSFFSGRRVIVCGGIVVLAMTPPTVAAYFNADKVNIWVSDDGPLPLIFIVSALLLSISISITQSLAAETVRLIRKAPRAGLIVMVSMVLIQYLLLVAWVPVVSTVQRKATGSGGDISEFASSLLSSLREMSRIGFSDVWQTAQLSGRARTLTHMTPRQSRDGSVAPEWYWSLELLGLLPNLGRLTLLVVFVGSFLLKPIHKAVLTLFARVIEDGRPVVTLVFLGVAAFVQAAAWILRNI